MSSRTLYIDANCKVSRKENVTNNRYHYPLEDAINLPIGTQISLNTSLINLQGTQGGSITLAENFEDEMLVGSYITDTFYETPSVYPPNYNNFKGGAYNHKPIGIDVALTDGMARNNYEFATGLEVDEDTLGTLGFQYTQAGGTETPFPMVRVQHVDAVGDLDDRVFATPVVHKVKIFLKAGVYSVDDFAEQISNQINGRGNKFFKDKSNTDYFSINNTNQKVASNQQVLQTFALCDRPQTTNAEGDTYSFPYYRSSLWEYSQKPDVQRKTATNVESIWNTTGVGDDPLPLGVGAVSEFFYDLDGNAFMEDGTTPAYQRVLRGCGVTMKHYNEMLDVYKYQTEEDILANPTTDDKNNINSIHFNEFNQTLTRGNNRAVIFPMDISPFADEESIDNKLSRARYLSVNTGSFDFNLSFDANKSIFNLSNLHQPRRQPSVDLLGNTMPNPSAISIYSKRTDESLLTTNSQQIPQPGSGGGGLEFLNTNQYGQPFTSIVADSATAKKITTMINKVMTRLSGCFVINWSLRTCQSERTYDSSNHPYFENFANFEDYFKSREESENAWRKTLWSRLGFGFDQICSERSYEEHNMSFTGRDKQKLKGFTTDMKVTGSVIPSTSSLYNTYSIAGGKDEPDVDAPGTIKTGTGYTQNIPSVPLSTSNAQFIKAYLSSFYSRAVMAPVVTTEVPIGAEGLPQLEEDGYLVITSNSFNKTDTLKKKVPSMLLDMVPISALNSRDFIQNRNMLTHILTNSVILNELNINVLRPDLTDVPLKENSTCLIQIVIPETISTPIIQNAILQKEAQDVLKPPKNEEQPAKK